MVCWATIMAVCCWTLCLMYAMPRDGAGERVGSAAAVGDDDHRLQ